MVIRPSLLVLPQEYVMDVYLSVRLEAGTLHKLFKSQNGSLHLGKVEI